MTKSTTYTSYIQETHDAPPPYLPSYQVDYQQLDHTFTIEPQYATSDASSSQSGPLLFPHKLIYDTAWVSSTSYLGSTKDQPLYAVVTPNRMFGCFDRGSITLCSGLDKDSAPIASVKLEKGSKCGRSVIRVMSPSGAIDEENDLEISMNGSCTSKQEFTIPLSAGLTTERFEWRSSHGHEVKVLSGGFNFGWKLVRLDGPPIAPSSVDRKKGGYSSDGKDIVAVGVQPRIFKRNPEFQFLATGATGQLGETFGIVAVMGFLRLCELAAQQTAAGAAGASSSSSAAAAAVA